MELAIETVGELSSVAVSDGGKLLGEITWESGRRHTPSLVPMIERVCALADAEGEAGKAGKARTTRAGLEVVIVDVGPGAYGGIRAGMAAAIGLATALGLECVGVGRLELQSYAHAAAGSATAIHRASRRSWVWQTFGATEGRWEARSGPSVGDAEELLEALGASSGAVVCGDTEVLDAEQRARVGAERLVLGEALNARRAGLLAELGYRRWREGGGVAPAALEPLYLREPAIGPQPS